MKIAINGLGRIGSCTLRALFEQGREDITLVAINARKRKGESLEDYHQRLLITLQYDSAHGRMQQNIRIENDKLCIDQYPPIVLLQADDPSVCPWGDLGVDVVLECTGQFKSKESAELYLKGGAKQVLISAPGGEGVERTIVYGVNHDTLRASDTIVSNASCTTNCLAPVLHAIQTIGTIEQGFVTTVHAATNDQCLIDSSHSDLRRARSAMVSMIPTKTGAAKTIGKIIPSLDQKLDGYAIRVPTLNVSMIDVTLQMAEPVSIKAVNEAFCLAEQGALNGVLATHREPLVSIDFNHHPASSIVDLAQTRTQGTLLKVAAWYDNEWAFACRMLDSALAMHQKAQ